MVSEAMYEFYSSYEEVEEYNQDTVAYISANRMLGDEHEEETTSLNEYILYIIEKEASEKSTFIKNSSMFDSFLGMSGPIIVNPSPSNVKYYGVGIMHDEEMSEKKSAKELFKEAYEECKAGGGIGISEFPTEDRIKYYEDFYGMKTDDFMEWFKERNYEGNVDMQMWALYARNRNNSGIDE